jgi:hypothetical protein
VGRHHEVIVEGPRGIVFGFTLGYLAGRGLTESVYDAEGEGFDCAPLRERLGDLLRPGTETVHLLVPEALLNEVRKAVEEANRTGHRMAVLSERPVEARFRFSFTTASREHAARLRGLLEKPGGGLRLAEESAFQERIDPGARGSEAYAPVHEYEAKGRGAVEGPVDALLDLHRRCRDEELLHVGDPHLLDAQA